MKADTAWGWALAGKHPVVKDYLRIGQASPLMDAFSMWMEEGYKKVTPGAAPYSWRFFARGRRPGELSCGLVRDSRDGAGRPFPLLILGWGVLERWEQGWAHVPYRLDGLWDRIELLCARRAFDLEELKRDVVRLGEPSPETGTRVQGGPVTMEFIPQHRGMSAASLPGTAHHLDEISALLLRMETPGHAVPGAVFMGGPPSGSFVAAFFRPLVPDDFVRLWTMDEGNAH